MKITYKMKLLLMNNSLNDQFFISLQNNLIFKLNTISTKIILIFLIIIKK